MILAGTTEATALAHRVAEQGIAATVSFAGRVDRPRRQPLPQRLGSFGGVEGLVAYLHSARITHVVDATHPFAVRMSRNAVGACARTGLPLLALTRPAWTPAPGDRWQTVPDIQGAVAALDQPRKRVLLAVGRMHLPEFAVNPQHFYLLRLVDPPTDPVLFPDAHVIVDRGPFEVEADRHVMRSHRIELVVSKNSGGSGAFAKIAAARALDLPVIMIDRPAPPPRREVHTVDAVMSWLAHPATALGV